MLHRYVIALAAKLLQVQRNLSVSLLGEYAAARARSRAVFSEAEAEAEAESRVANTRARAFTRTHQKLRSEESRRRLPSFRHRQGRRVI